MSVPDRMTEMQSLKTHYSDVDGWDCPDWLRAWPFGPVHFSADWTSRRDGRFNTVCGKSPIYWPTTEWPEQDVCRECKAWVEANGAGALMRYGSPGGAA